MKNAVLIATCLVASGAALVAQAQAPPQGQSRIIQKVLVKVNGEVFTQTEFERRLVEAIREKKPTVNSARDFEKDAALAAIVAEVSPDIIVQAVDELLMVQHGREIGFHVSDERFKTFVDQFKKDKNLTDAQLKAALEEEGLSMDVWREMAEHGMIINDVQRDELVPKAQVTEEELHQYYNAHKDEFMTPATMTFREIVVSVPTQLQNNKPVINAAAAEEALKKATAIRDRVVKGEDFVKVAAEVSDSSTKDNGGLLGTFNLDDIDPSLRQRVDKLKVGDLTEPLLTTRGYQILKIDALAPPELKPFDKVRDDLRYKVGTSRIDVEQDKFLVKLRRAALIEWKDDSLKKLYDKRMAELAAAAK